MIVRNAGCFAKFFVALLILSAGAAPLAAGDKAAHRASDVMAGLPPAMGASEPKVMPVKGEDALYHHDWFVKSFLDLADDLADAKARGKRLVVIFEQRGCSYCVKLQTETLATKYINDYVRNNFAVIQLNMWGARNVTDFDGTVMNEKRLAARWGVLFTPTIIFFKDDLDGLAGKWGRPLEVVRVNQVGKGTIYDIFTWVKHKVYKKDPNFQRFHIARINQRRALSGEKFATDGTPLNKGKTH